MATQTPIIVTPERAPSTTLSMWRTLGANKRAEAKAPAFLSHDTLSI